MAGSIKWMVYRADNGNDYACKIDESNGELADFDDYGDDTPNLPTVKQAGISMRYVACVSQALGIRRKIYVGKPNSSLFIAGGVVQLLVALSGVSAALRPFAIVGAFPEKTAPLAKPFAMDTGLLDGDDT